MIILGYLMQKKAIPGSDFYIGVSKKCCLKCELVIAAVNSIFGPKLQQGEGEDKDQHLSFRAAHGYVFPGICPPFLLENNQEAIKNKFLTIFKEQIRKLVNDKEIFLINDYIIRNEEDIPKLTILDIFNLQESKKVSAVQQNQLASDDSPAVTTDENNFREISYNESPKTIVISEPDVPPAPTVVATKT